MKKFLTLISILFVLAPNFAHATLNRVSVSPAVIDEKALARDIFNETIRVTNITSSRIDVYAIVNNIDVSDGKQHFESVSGLELQDSLANWIKISRAATELGPGEYHDFDVSINVNLRADPGKYHALISFMWGGSRAFAEENAKYGVSTAVNIEVVEDVRERLQLGGFTTRELFFTTPEVSFSYNLENTGNKDLVPKGEVRIYDRKGREVGMVVANKDASVIAPSETGEIASAWTATKKFGKYKAMLDIEYGSSQVGTVNDTIYFWVIPWKSLLGLFLTLATILSIFVYFWWGRYETTHEPEYARVEEKRQYAKETDSVFVEGTVLGSFVSNAPTDSHVMDMRE